MLQRSSHFVALGISQRSPKRLLAGLAIAFAAFALLLRWPVLGNPVVHIDEEFYRLVGDRMLQGAIPYVDVWDRKPIGLFLIFAAIGSLTGPGVLAGQIAAIGFVAATALVIFAMASRLANRIGGVLAGLGYIAALDLAGGEACQAPVWYNLPVAGAIACVFFARSSARGARGDFRSAGTIAMALFGVAMQIKYSAFFEGLFLGAYLVIASRRRGRPLAALALDVPLWIAAALLPTIAAALVYVAIGHGQDWLYANVLSILHRGVEPPAMVRLRIVQIIAVAAPLALAIPLRAMIAAPPVDAAMRADRLFVDLWAATAVLGVIVFGTWYNHYALPLFVPLAIAAAPLATRRAGRVYLGTVLLLSVLWGEHMLQRHIQARGDARMLAQVTAAIGDHRRCIFVYDGFVAAYESSRSCLPTSRIFPNHFAGLNERGATGLPGERIVATVMRARPDRVTSMEPAYPNENRRARAIFYGFVHAGYAEIARFRRGDRWLVVYGLRAAPVAAS